MWVGELKVIAGCLGRRVECNSLVVMCGLCIASKTFRRRGWNTVD